MIRLFQICLIIGALSQSALAASPEYIALSERLVMQAATALQAQETAKADGLLNLALTANPANARAYMLKGETMRRQGQPKEGLRLITIGLEIDPINVEGLILQGEAALDANNLQQAQDSLAQAQPLCEQGCVHAVALANALARIADRDAKDGGH